MSEVRRRVRWVKAHHASPYSRIVSHCKRGGRHVTMDVTVPANSRATVITPDGKPHEAGPGKRQFKAKRP